MMHVLEYLIYHLRPYGQDTKKFFTGKLVNGTSADYKPPKVDLPANHDGDIGTWNISKIIWKSAYFVFNCIWKNILFIFLSSFSATCSSVYGSKEEHDCHFAIDGKISDSEKGIFHSDDERFPWLQVKLGTEKTISSVTIVNRKDSNGWRLADIEVRAGMIETTQFSTKKRLESNPICGTFKGPGKDGETYTINCETPIKAKYVTVQIVPKVEFPNVVPSSILQINELTFNANNT